MKRLRTQQNYLIKNEGETKKSKQKIIFYLEKYFFLQGTDAQSNCYIKLSSSVNKGFVGAIFQFALTLTLSVTLSCFKKTGDKALYRWMKRSTIVDSWP